MNELQNNDLITLETEIKVLKGQAVQNLISIGKKLIKAKELVPHGKWSEWLDTKIDFSERYAQQMMKLAREFSNPKSISDLGQTKAFKLLSVPSDKREDFIKNNPVKDMTTRELEKAIKKQKQAEKEKEALEKEIQELKNRPPKVIKEEIEVIPEHYKQQFEYYEKTTEKYYRLQETVKELKRDLADKEFNLERLEKEKSILERKAKLNDDDSKKYKQLKNQIENLSKQKNDLGRQLNARTELSGLVVRVENTLKKELAPVKYSRAIEEARHDEIVINNLKDIIGRVQEWCDEMYEYLPNERYGENIIDAEVINYE